MVPGAVRRHVAATELDAWSTALSDCSVQLVVLGGDSYQYVPDSNELTIIRSHLDACTASIAERGTWLRQRKAEEEARRIQAHWEKTEHERIQRQRKVPTAENLRTCSCPHQQGAIRVGDLVQTHSNAPFSGAGVVESLGSIIDNDRRIPDELCSLLMWNADHKGFTRSKADVELYHVYKTPLCCGQVECYNLRVLRMMEVLRKGYSELEKRRVIPAQKRTRASMEDAYYGEDCGSEERSMSEIMGIQQDRPKCMSSDGEESESDISICDAGPDESDA